MVLVGTRVGRRIFLAVSTVQRSSDDSNLKNTRCQKELRERER